MNETGEKLTKGPFDVNRTIPLFLVPAEKLQQAVEKISRLEPVIDVHADRQDRLHIRYDASVVSIRDIERLLDEAGVVRPSGFWWRFKLAWYRFLDDNARSNALSKGGACCSRPPSKWSRERDVDRTP